MNRASIALSATMVALFLAACPAAAGQAKQAKIPVLFDFDIGEDIDDTFALATVLASPELDLRGVTTVGHDAYKRAQMACRFLTAVGRREIPVAAGRDKSDKPLAYWQVQYGNHASVYYRDPKPAKEKAPEFLYKQIMANPGELTLIAVGPLTNVAQLFTDHPDAKAKLKRLVIMGGSVRRGYGDKSPPAAEYNIVADAKAAQVVFSSGVPLVVAPLDSTAMVRLDADRQKKLFGAGSLLTLSIQALVQLWQEKNDPILYDPVAVTLTFTEKFCTMEELALEVDAKGFTKIAKDAKPNARVATAIRTDAFLDWLVDRLAGAYPKSLPSGRVVNKATMTPRGMMPNRVHVFEDFETDIEKRWWLSGRIETANVPSGSRRACRGTLTQDFDDRQGEMKTLYMAVVFNPVPGPPMGKKPHLSFRYWLKGTDTLRVQIYSLTNGYHRCLTLTGLTQEKWLEGNVDMGMTRKPDGTGGPLSENERIDDIQFYADPRAELLIDDIVLYDAALPEEKRPFPERFQFTAGFDTGKQGKEWPGLFEIAAKQGYFWNAARSVKHPKLEVPVIQVGLRGGRPLGATTHLSFRCKITGSDTLNVTLVANKETMPVTVKDLTQGGWAETTVDLSQPGLRAGDLAREISFRAPQGAELLIDDLLLYEPGKSK